MRELGLTAWLPSSDPKTDIILGETTMPLSNRNPTPKVDPLLRIRRTDTAENLRQKADVLLQKHDDNLAYDEYRLAAAMVEASGLKTFGEWEASVLAKAGTSVEQEIAGLKEEFGEDWSDPYMAEDHEAGS